MSFVSSTSPSSTYYSPYSPTISFQGLESGLNTSSIVNALMAQYSQPLVDLQSQQKTDQRQISSYQTISADLQSLYRAAEALSAPGALSGSVSASSSDPAVATATVGSGATAGSATFVVDRLAQASAYVSSGTVASTSDVVSGPDLLVGVGGQALGISTLSAGSGLATGSHSIDVTQASAGATITGSGAPASTTTIGSTNDQVSVSLDGASAVTYTLASGTYTPSQLAAALASASGGTLSASVDSAGNLVVSTTEQGSHATLSITGGSALGSLGLTTSTSAATGTDAIVNVDGTSNTVSDIAGSGTTQLTLSSGTGGSVDLGVTGGLSLGSMKADYLSTQGGSLAGVVQAINGSGLAVSATAVQVASGGYALEISSQKTGTTGSVTLDPTAFGSSPLGNLDLATAAQDAQVSVGGAGGPELTSSSNTVTGLVPGVSVDLLSASTSPVTVSVTPDGSVVAPKVKALVDAANKVLGDIATSTAYDARTKTAGPLNGQYGLTALADRVLATVSQALGVSSLGASAQAAGVGLTSTGTLTFDQSAFDSAYNANPSAVASLLTQAGSFSPSSSAYAGQVSLVAATDATAPGSYAVSITHAATQALDSGTVGFSSSSSTLGSSGSYTVTAGSSSATVSLSSTETLSQAVTAMDAAFAHAGMDLSAEVTNNSSGQATLSIVSSAYGSAQSFTVSAGASDPLGLASASAFTGSDVAGSIDGVAATGNGQYLSAPSSDPTLAGLTLQVTTPSVGGATTIGTFTYAPGMAQSLATLAHSATTGPGGVVAAAVAGLQADTQDLSSQISVEQQVVDQERAMLQQEFTHLETSLAQLKSQGSALTSALSSGGIPQGG